MKEVTLDQLTCAALSAQVKTRFRVQVDATNELELELVEVRQLQPQPQPTSTISARKNECFSLLFNGPGSRCLEQKIYPFKHEQLGQFSLFMVPIGKNQGSFQYEVVFNRFV
jgi:hypothetical protein